MFPGSASSRSRGSRRSSRWPGRGWPRCSTGCSAGSPTSPRRGRRPCGRPSPSTLAATRRPNRSPSPSPPVTCSCRRRSRHPVVVVVDDLPWIDAPTRRTLAYIARRLQFERVAIMSARRAGTDAQSDTGPTYVLDAVDDDVADRILVDAGVDSADVRRQLIAASGGVPLVLVEATNLIDADQRAGRAELPDPLPIGSSGQRVVDLVFARLSPARAGRPPRGRGRAGRRSRPHRARPRRAGTRPRRAGAGGGARGGAARGRSGHLPPPADAVGGVPRRAPRRPAGRPPGARGHAPGRSAGAGVAPGARRRRAGRGRRPLPRRRRRGDGPTRRADGRRPHVGAGQPVVARPDRPGPTARAGRRRPPRRRDGGAGRPTPRPGRRGVPRRSERRRRDRAGAPAAAPLAPASIGRRRLLAGGRAAGGGAGGQLRRARSRRRPAARLPGRVHGRRQARRHDGARSRKRSGCARSSTRNGPGAST